MFVLFDIGGTKTRVATSENLLSFSEPVTFDTPPQFYDAVRVMKDTIDEVTAGSTVDVIAGGIRGVLEKDKTTLHSEVRLTDWVGKPIAKTLGDIVDAPAYLENDAALAALGEAHYGAGKGEDIVAYHTVSTGVGGARIDHGVIDSVSVGFEPGHQAIDADGTLCASCETTTLEGLVSGTALEKRTGKKPYDIPQDDPVWDELASWLAYGLKNTIMYWSPDVIVLGGSMILGDPRILQKDIAKHTKKVLAGKVPCPPILDAKLEDYSALYGAMALIRQKEQEQQNTK